MSTNRSIPKEIVHKARTKLGVKISYQKSWRTKEHIVKILHGDTVESYALILRFFDKLVESNPGMIRFLYQIFIDLQIDVDRLISQSI